MMEELSGLSKCDCYRQDCMAYQKIKREVRKRITINREKILDINVSYYGEARQDIKSS